MKETTIRSILFSSFSESKNCKDAKLIVKKGTHCQQVQKTTEVDVLSKVKGGMFIAGKICNQEKLLFIF